ncbi:hypothetical protein B484DRAFT_55930 [Ochromonadaceae sp. CCMP2298]|nr:hypothetical protein B484DRAFT_55930 [Ochromonadaceae sp. CCMP2298]
MSNALKFTPTLGCVSVHAEWLPAALADAQIDMTPEEAQQWQHPRAGAVRVSVTDTGVGLSPAQLLEIGAEGVQFNANQLQAGQGSGLGLFISKGIAQQAPPSPSCCRCSSSPRCPRTPAGRGPRPSRGLWGLCRGEDRRDRACWWWTTPCPTGKCSCASCAPRSTSARRRRTGSRRWRSTRRPWRAASPSTPS